MSVSAEEEAAWKADMSAFSARDPRMRRMLQGAAVMHRERAREIAYGEYRLIVIGSDDWPPSSELVRADLELNMANAVSKGCRQVTVVHDIGNMGVAGLAKRWCDERAWLQPRQAIRVQGELSPRGEDRAAEQCRLLRLAESPRPDKVLLYSLDVDARVRLAHNVFVGRGIPTMLRESDSPPTSVSDVLL